MDKGELYVDELHRLGFTVCWTNKAHHCRALYRSKIYLL